jgi:serine/threonine protein phosphatase PrpC
MTIGRATALSHPGRKRRRNEDAWVCQPPIFAVADGMGGARGGEIASRLAAAALREDETGTTGEDRVIGLIQEANRRVYERSSEDSDASGMGTTVTLALVEDGAVTIGHVGDSRAYLIRERELEQLTDDHSLVAELVRSGRLSPEEAESHPQRSVITRALGTDPDVDVDTLSVEAKPGDLFLICSDGLTSMVGDEVILDIVERNRGNLEAAAKELVNTANRSGGEDNITVVFFEIAEEGSRVLEETRPMPAVDDSKRAEADEDTLSGLERVPAVDTMVVAPEDVEDAAQAPPRRRRRWRALALVLILLLLLAGAAALYWYLYL